MTTNVNKTTDQYNNTFPMPSYNISMIAHLCKSDDIPITTNDCLCPTLDKKAKLPIYLQIRQQRMRYPCVVRYIRLSAPECWIWSTFQTTQHTGLASTFYQPRQHRHLRTNKAYNTNTNCKILVGQIKSLGRP